MNAIEPDAIKQRVTGRSNFMTQGYFGEGNFKPRGVGDDRSRPSKERRARWGYYRGGGGRYMDCAVTGAASLARAQLVSMRRHCYGCSLNCAIRSTDSLLCRNRPVIGVNLCKGAVPMSLGTNEVRAISEKNSRITRAVGANGAVGALVEYEVSKW